MSATVKQQSPHVQAPDVSVASFLRLGTPLWLSNLAGIGGACIDTAMAGHLSAEDLAATGIGSSVMVTATVTLMGTVQAISPVAGQHYGAGRNEQVGESALQCMWIALICSIIGVCFVSAHDFWIDFSGSSGILAQKLSLYLTLAAFGIPGMLMQRILTCLNAAVSKPIFTTITAFSMLVVRVPLNWALMHGVWGAPNLGGAGAGLTSALTSWLGLFLLLGIWGLNPVLKSFLPRKFSRPNRAVISELLRIGIPIGLTSFCMIACYRSMGILLGRFGPQTAAANQVVASIDILLYATPNAIALATCVLVSQAIGAGSYATARSAVHRGLLYGLILCATQSAILGCFRQEFISLFTDVSAVTAIAAGFVTFAAAYHTFDGTSLIASMALRGYKITFPPMLVQCACLGIIGMGLGYCLAFGLIDTWQPGAIGFWIALTAGTLTACLVIVSMCLVIAQNKANDCP